MILVLTTVVIFFLVIIFLISNCSFCRKSHRSHEQINSTSELKQDCEVPTYMNESMNYQNPEPAHPSQIPKDQDFAEFPSITSQIEAVSMTSSSINTNEQREKLQTSVLVYPPNQ